MKRSIPALVMTGALALSLPGCLFSGAPDVPSPPAPIQALIDDTPLPLAQEPVWQAIGAASGITYFWISYGHPQDCPSGCFHSRAIGLLVGEKAEWVMFDDFEGIDRTDATTFRITDENRGYFSQEFVPALEKAQPQFYRHEFLRLVAADSRPNRWLIDRALGSLFSYIDPGLALALLNNPFVSADRELLFTLAGLPHFQGDPYANVRAEARRLLGVSLTD